jgi:beta-fructofuranosidase
MTLRLADRWLWDFWLARDGPDYHLFYLQALRALKEERLRHWNATVGHAVSQNLVDWQVLPDALAPSPPGTGAWDDYTTWTGSVIHHEGRWHMFYTGGRRAEGGLVQRIGLATSKDLLHWEKHPANPLIEVDPRWYETLDTEIWHDQAWRDPWIFHHPRSDDFHALITARVNHGPPDGRGVIAHARSEDLLHWEVRPPLTEPGDYGQMEVPQLIHAQGRYYLIFCTADWTHSARWRDRVGRPALTGVYYLVAENPLGPFHRPRDGILAGDRSGSYYAGKLVRSPEDRWVFLAARMMTPQGEFLGELSDPHPVQFHPDGSLSVESSLPGRAGS